MPARNRPDKDGTHRGAFEKNKRKIYATRTICGICGKPVDMSLRWPNPMSKCIDHIIPVRQILTICNLHICVVTERKAIRFLKKNQISRWLR